MKYMGGKYRVSKKISGYINDTRKEQQSYIEPFVGGGAIIINIDTINNINICSDIHEGLITLYNNIKSGWLPPDVINEIEYKRLKFYNDQQNPLTAFAGFGCSYGGKYFGGYARSGNRIPPENYCAEAKHFFTRLYPKLADISFLCCDYSTHNTTNTVFYCDPPYKSKTAYTNKFDHEKFYEWLIHMSKNGNTMIISEYSMPYGFECIMELPTKTSLNNVNSHINESVIEKLWTIKK